MKKSEWKTCPNCGERYQNPIIDHWDDRANEGYETELDSHGLSGCIQYLRSLINDVGSRRIV